MSVLQTKIDELEAEVSQLKGGGTVSGNDGTDTSSVAIRLVPVPILGKWYK